MALIKVKPTSAGRRAVIKVVNGDLHKGAPYAPLLESQSKHAGRNHNGRITVRHQGGGHKQHYRVVDFRRNKDGIPANVERLEYDPNRSAHVALLCYADGERRYIIAPKGVSAGMQLISGSDSPIKVGNTLPLRNIPVGTTIHCVEMMPTAKGRSWLVPRVRRSSCWRVKVLMHSCGCGLARFARCMWTARRPLAKWVTLSIVCVLSARPVQCAGAVFARRFVVWS
jgi:ribosomal protein L2